MISDAFDAHRRVAEGLPGLIEAVESAAHMLVTCYRAGGKTLVMGNGGSAADSQHFAAELVGRYKRERRALPSIALTTDTSVLTAVANDYTRTSSRARSRLTPVRETSSSASPPAVTPRTSAVL